MNRQEFLEAYFNGRRDFRDSDLTQWDLNGQVLTEVDLSYAVLHNVNLCRAKLYSSSFQRSELTSARLYGANLRQANLKRALFKDANLRAVDLSRSDLSEANFTGADLRGADLRLTKGLQSANWQDAVYDEFTQFPDDINPQTLGMIQISESIQPMIEIQKSLNQTQLELSQLQTAFDISSAKLSEQQQECESLKQQLSNALLELQNISQSDNQQNNSETSQAKPSNSNFIEKIHTSLKAISLEMIFIPSGSIQINFPLEVQEVDPDLISAFYISKYPITQTQYQGITGKNPSHFQGEDLPVEQISWDEAILFCQQLSRKSGRSYRLPSETEWEYACRAGATTQYFFGDNSRKLGEHAWYAKNSGNKTRPVGQKKPNAWGLYDMHGNVWEWCQDLHQPTFSYRENSRPLRGGSWNYDDRYCTCTRQLRLSHQHQANYLGFRVVCSFQ